MEGPFETPHFLQCQMLANPTTHKGVSKPMGFKIPSLGDFKPRNFGAPAIWGTRLGGCLAPKKVSKSIGFKMASSEDFQNSQFWCTGNSGLPLCVFPKIALLLGPPKTVSGLNSAWRRFCIFFSGSGNGEGEEEAEAKEGGAFYMEGTGRVFVGICHAIQMCLIMH